ncbi:MAG: T9SS type A sorting domain-containing protein [Ferruginibacter sp.]
MKTFLLMAISIAFALNSSAQQNVPLFENFENGLPPGWQLKAANIDVYDRIVNGNCVTGNHGVVSNPSVGSNGNNKTGFLTDTLRYVQANAFVTVRFEGYIYSGNRLRCEDQLFGTTPCTAVGVVYIVSVATGDTIGTSAVTNLDLNSGQNTIITRVDENVALNTEFRVLLDVSQLDCAVNGAKRFVIDNVYISVTEGGPLAVNFKSFKATRTSSQNVLVNWTTATEQNNRGFYVQRMTNGTWQNISFVPTRATNGNSSGDLSYSFTDLNNYKGISQYRIVQVDMNGMQRTSQVSIVRGEQKDKMTVFPNPTANGNTTVLFEDESSSRDIAVIDMTGRVVKQWTNVNTNSLRIENLMPGFYNIKVFNRSTGKQSIGKITVDRR